MNPIVNAYIAAILLFVSHIAVAGGEPEAGQAKAQVCASCHAADGNSTAPEFPKLAGQHADYIVRALLDYQSGARANAIMKGFVANLSRQDMEDLAAYFASQQGTLFTPTDY